MAIQVEIKGLSPQRFEEAIGVGSSVEPKWAPYVYLVPSELVEIVSEVPRPPQRILLGSLGDSRFRIQTPIAVKFSSEGDQVIAEAEEFNEFGFGTNPSAALRDLQRTLTELYLTLEQEQHRLGSDLLRVWERLGQAISRR